MGKLWNPVRCDDSEIAVGSALYVFWHGQQSDAVKCMLRSGTDAWTIGIFLSFAGAETGFLFQPSG